MTVSPFVLHFTISDVRACGTVPHRALVLPVCVPPPLGKKRRMFTVYAPYVKNVTCVL
jgi:hypothetical protein